jgi:hypothetical protein
MVRSTPDAHPATPISDQYPDKLCRNCGNALIGKYCHACRQKSNDGRIAMPELIRDLLAELLTLESPLLRTLKDLTLRPGKMCLTFIRGRRKSYYRPVQYFLLLLGIFLVIKALSNFDWLDNQSQVTGKPSLPESTDEYTRATHLYSNYINIFYFALIFLLAFVARLVFYKSRYSYAEYLTFGFFVIGHSILLNFFLIPLALLDPRIYYLIFPLTFVYLSAALMQFHQHRGLLSFLLNLLVVMVSNGFWAIITFYLVLAYLKLFA